MPDLPLWSWLLAFVFWLGVSARVYVRLTRGDDARPAPGEDRAGSPGRFRQGWR